MSVVERFQARLTQNEAVVMDGALGTELTQRGVELGEGCWSALALTSGLGCKVIGEIHRDNLSAGAEAIRTNTFRTPALEGSAEVATLIACAIARRAREETEAPDAVIAGSAGPIGDCYSSADKPPKPVLWDKHRRHADNLAKGGVDIYFAETMNNLEETEIALIAGQEADLPVAVSFHCDNYGQRLESGESLKEAAELAMNFDTTFIGVNCVDLRTASMAFWFLKSLKNKLPIAVCAQGYDPSSPVLIPGIGREDYRRYYVHVSDWWLELGAQIVGGCCGVSPDYISDISQLTRKRNQVMRGSISESESERVD